MGYKTLHAAVVDLEKSGQLVRVTEEIDADLELAAVHRRINAMGGPALLFENVKGASFPAVSNIFGTAARARYLFRDAFEPVKAVLRVKAEPQRLMNPATLLKAIRVGVHTLPRRSLFGTGFRATDITRIPILKSWPRDGGKFITLPLVYTEHPAEPGIMCSNLGMYRIQTSGNEFTEGKTMGMHYQIHRGIGIHHTAAIAQGKPLKVTIMVGGPPALMLAAVMPLPENISELLFASMLNLHAFRYKRRHGYLESPWADFLIHGEVHAGETLPEGPFGDHLGYYSLTHNFPVLRVTRVLARKKDAIWPFTVVGRPPQEDSEFGRLIHDLTHDLIATELPGVKEVHAVDAAGVHPLLLALGSERYLPYMPPQPREILTQANAILGFNQMSLAKYLFITADEAGQGVSVHRVADFLRHILERVDFTRDLHFQTRTTMDSLDYTGAGLHEGSKLVIAAYGKKLRELATELSGREFSRYKFRDAQLAQPGILVIRGSVFRDYRSAEFEIRSIASAARDLHNQGIMLIVIADDAQFTAKNLDNLLWVTFTRSDPARDIYGVDSSIENKHWGCKGALIIDARSKHHHAGVLTEDARVEERVNRFFRRSASLGKFA